MHQVKPTSSNLPPAQQPTPEGAPSVEIPNLPSEIWLKIFKDLKVSDAVKSRTVCSGWNILLTDNLLWRAFLNRDFPGRVGLPTKTDYRDAYKKLHTHILGSPLGKGVCEQRLLTPGYNCSVTALVYAGRRLFSATMANKIRIWNLKTDTCSNILEGHKDGIASLLCVGGQLISTSFDETIKFWDIKDKGFMSITVYEPFTSICHAKNTLFFGSINGTIMSWDLVGLFSQDLPEKDIGEEDRGEITCLAFGDQKLCIGSTGNAIEIWDTENQCYLEPLVGHQKAVASLIYAEKFLFSGSFDGTIKVWDIETSICLDTLKGDRSPVTSLTYADGHLISGHANGTIKIWNLVTRTCLHTLETPHQLKEGKHGVSSLCYKNEVLFAGYESGAIAIFDFNKSAASIKKEENS